MSDNERTVTNASEASEPMEFRFVHIADLHLAPRSGTIAKRDPVTNRLIRDLDMSNALAQAVDDVLSQDHLPSALVIAGDIFDTYQGSQDAIIDCADQLKRIRSAGISIVGIAGNHDTPTQRKKTPAYVVLKHEFEDIADDDGVHLAYDKIEHVLIGGIEYVLLPHLAVISGQLKREDIAPNLGAARSVLVVHGVASGDPSLRQMDEMKEIPIAKWIMDMPWDYIAFGHYHKPGWIKGYEGKAAYCGSLENTVISGPDVCMRRGPVYVDLSAGGEGNAVAEMHPQSIRRIIDIGVEDISGLDMSADELDDMIAEKLDNPDYDDTIVLGEVRGVPRSTIKTMKRRSFQSARPDALFVRVKITPDDSVASKRRYNVESADDPTDDDAGAEQADAVDTEESFRPLQKEIESALDSMVAGGDIRASIRDDVLNRILALM